MVHPTSPQRREIEGTRRPARRAEPIEVMVDGRRRPGYTIGEGPLVILAHGWGDRAAQMADLATAVAAAGFLAVAIDAPGHGSDSQSTSDGFQIAAGLRGHCRPSGPPDAVVAHSLGAMASVMAFHDAPPRSAVFLAPVLDLDEALARFARHGRARPMDRFFAAAQGPGLRRRRWPEPTAGAEADLPGTEILILHDPADPEVPIAASSELAGAGRRRGCRDAGDRPPQTVASTRADRGGHRVPRRDVEGCAGSRLTVGRDWLTRSAAIGGRRAPLAPTPPAPRPDRR